MFKVIVEHSVKEKVLTMADLEPCQMAVVTEEHRYHGAIVMRTANVDEFEVMDLSDPRRDGCWTSIAQASKIKIKLLPKGTKLTLEVV